MNHSRILILMSETGGGHRASAMALQAAFAARYPGRFQVEIVDPWTDYTPWPINRIPRVYSPIIVRALWFWKLLWFVSESKIAMAAVLRLVYLISRNDLRKLLKDYSPHVIISVHPFMQHIFLRLLEEERASIPFATVVTDLASFHYSWFHARAARCFVASEAAAATAVRHGLHARQVRMLGLPVRPVFADSLPVKATARVQLGLEETAFTTLLLGGGEGLGPVAATAHAVADRLAAAGTPAQLVVICGRNERLRRALQRSDWPVPVRVCGFVENMQEWMAASDCVITKAGPGTIAEALICGLPILLSGFIPGQEEGNVSYVVENGAGAYRDTPDGIAATVSEWAAGSELARMAASARKLGRPRAAFDIVDEIAALIDGEAAEV